MIEDSTDGQGAGDCDLPYVFGREPTLYLHTLEVARLLLLRSRLSDRQLLRFRRGDFTPTETE